MKALVADDNRENLYMLESLLKGNGFQVASARNGEEALERLRAESIDIIVSDILMPGMDGYRLCREIKADPALRDIPFVFYTATYTDPKDFEFGLSLGADRFLVKPMDPDAILQELSGLLASRASSPSDRSGDPSPEEMDFLRLHNEALFRKLEKKMAALEEANRELEKEVRTRERTEKELRESERRFREALEFLPVPIGIAEKGGRMLFFNRDFTRRFGYAIEDTPTIEDWVEKVFPDPAYRSTARDTWNRDIAGGDGKDHPARSFRVSCKDGGERSVEISVAPLGGLFLFAYNDVTDQHKTEDLLRQSQKMEALGTMAGGVAHDFNNILTVIMSCATLLKMHIARDAKSDSLVNEIVASVERAADMTRSLLAFSRKQATKLEPGNLNKVVSTLEKSLRRLIREDIAFRIDPRDGAVPVLMDRSQIEQVIVNLVVNARDAMPSGGVLSISSSAIEVADGVEAAGLPDGMDPGWYGRLAVSDTGIGMDAETRGRIFEPFFTTKEVGKGTGLGLSIVYGIVARHGGFLRVSSEKGRGTTFEVFLPMIPGGGEELSALPEGEGKSGSGTILLVEDEVAVRQIIGTVLEGKGYRVLSASNGEEGLAVFREHADDILLVVSDLIMPHMNGKKMSDEIHKVKEDMPFVFMSGYPDDIVLDKEEGGGRIVNMQKPFNPKELLDVVTDIIKGGGQSS